MADRFSNIKHKSGENPAAVLNELMAAWAALRDPMKAEYQRLDMFSQTQKKAQPLEAQKAASGAESLKYEMELLEKNYEAAKLRLEGEILEDWGNWQGKYLDSLKAVDSSLIRALSQVADIAEQRAKLMQEHKEASDAYSHSQWHLNSVKVPVNSRLTFPWGDIGGIQIVGGTQHELIAEIFRGFCKRFVYFIAAGQGDSMEYNKFISRGE